MAEPTASHRLLVAPHTEVPRGLSTTKQTKVPASFNLAATRGHGTIFKIKYMILINPQTKHHKASLRKCGGLNEVSFVVSHT